MIFGHNYLISEPIFKIFVALFRTHELQKADMVIFFLWCFRKVRFRKMQFLKDGVQTVTSKPDFKLNHVLAPTYSVRCMSGNTVTIIKVVRN